MTPDERLECSKKELIGSAAQPPGRSFVKAQGAGLS